MTSRIVLLVVLATLLAACGGSEEGGHTVLRGSSRDARSSPAPTGVPQPIRGDVHGRTRDRPVANRQGPGRVTSGPLSTATRSLRGTDYSITKEEREDVDAEVNFSGRGVSGQIKLLQSCKDRTDVTITIRPS